MPWTFEATARGYANLWRTATLKGGSDAHQADIFSDKIIAAEQRYRAVERATGVPWYYIGALHMRESSCNFAGVLHNGDRIIGTGGLTTRVPAGRGPFATWEASAIDALKLKDMHRVQDWSVARMLFQAEIFNGLGYVSKGVNSAYVWAGTNKEQLGKYIRDHVWDPTHDDTQLGVAAVLIRLAQKRPDIATDLYPTEKPMDDIADVLKELQELRADIAQLVNAIKGVVEPKPPEPKPEPKQPVVPTTPPPVLERPSVGASIALAGLGAILQMLGFPVIGEGATPLMQTIPAAAIGSAAMGLSGWGGILSGLMTTLWNMKKP